MSREYSAEELLRASYKYLPVVLFAKDTECRYVFSSVKDHLVSRGEDGTIIGKTDEEIQFNSKMGRTYNEQDRQIMATGKSIRAISEYWDGDKKVYREISRHAIYDDDGNVMGVSGIVSDVTELVELRQKFQQLSLFDALTGVYNRNYVMEYDFNSETYLPCGYIICDCNDLKSVNDTLGHEEGDRYIQEMCHTISDAVGDSGIVVRWGGDEFLVIVPRCDEELCKDLVKRIEKEQAILRRRMPYASGALGWMVRHSAEETEDEIIKQADSWMYKNKRKYKEQMGF